MLNKIKNIFNINNLNINAMNKLVKKIDSLELRYRLLSNEAIQEKIIFYRYQSSNGRCKNKEIIISNIFALVKEASYRIFNMKHYDVQLLGGLYLNNGYITEMHTGEGKTLVATCPAVYNSIIGNKVHIVTANDYLATRDYNQMKKLYSFLGLTTGLITSKSTTEERRENYLCDIVYGTNNEFGFDYLRDNMLSENDEPVQQGLDYVIIDEVDSILIDEARTPLVISAPINDNSLMYIQMASIVSELKENIDFIKDKDNKKNLIGTDIGIKKIEHYFNISNLYSLENDVLLNVFNQMLKAYFIFQRDKDYIVRNNEVLIVDSFTGRIMTGRRYSDGLHQAIEAKEHVDLKKESKTIATITFQNFFRLYKKMSGMTGTAKTEEKEFYSIYGKPVVQIPENKKNKRIDLPDVIFKNKEAKYKAIINKIVECHKKNQPILVGTTSIATSEYLSLLLTEENIKHNILNAKHDAEEAEIIKFAGKIGAVTIATNMAGRGTDIIPDDAVDDIGGLYILGTEKHESRRIDNQLRGRTARQGANGITEFYISLEDDIFKYFANNKILKLFNKYKSEFDDKPINNVYLSKVINNCQKKIETQNFDIRKHLLNYDDVLNQQRLVIYKQRNEIKKSNYEYIINNLYDLIKEYLTVNYLNVYANPNKYSEEWDLITLAERINVDFNLDDLIILDDIINLDKINLDTFIINKCISVIKFKNYILSDDILLSILKTILLKITDELWTEQINNMTILKDGINLRAYGQLNPLIEYKKESFEMFNEMKDNITSRFVKFALSFQISINS